MKKILGMALSITILCQSVLVAVSVPVTPVVLVAGYSSTNLFENADSDERQQVWKLETDTLLQQVVDEIIGILAQTVRERKGSFRLLTDTAGPLVAEVFRPLALNPDGSSPNNVSAWPIGAAATRYDALKKLGGEFIAEYHYMEAIAKRVGDKNLFVCPLDWRQSQVTCAAELKDYLDEVRALTGSAKVDITGISFGGQVVGTYLTLYEDDGIDDVVLNVPALDGTMMATRLFGAEPLKIRYDELLKFYMELDRDESYNDLLFLADTVRLNRLDGILGTIVQDYLLDIFVNFGSAWDFVAADKYEEYKARLLSDPAYTSLIQRSDVYHTRVQGRFAETFAALREKGIDVFIMAGTGVELLTGGGIDSDGVIDRLSSTGGTVPGTAPRVATAGYSISPGKTIDAGTGFLPDRTWYVDGLMHGQSFWDDASTQLLLTLLFDNTVRDVYSDDRWPQYMFAANPGNIVTGAFNASKSGYITRHDTAFVVKNLSVKYDIVIREVVCKGADIRVDINDTVRLAPGQTLRLGVHGTLPSGHTVCDVTIRYVRYADKAPVYETRTLTHGAIGDADTIPAILRSDADTQAVMDDGPRVVIRSFSSDFLLAKILYILKQLATVQTRLFA